MKTAANTCHAFHTLHTHVELKAQERPQQHATDPKTEKVVDHEQSLLPAPPQHALCRAHHSIRHLEQEFYEFISTCCRYAECWHERKSNSIIC